MSSALNDRTLALLCERQKSLSLRQIALAADLKPDWLEKFAAGGITSPGIINLEKLYCYLSGGKLNV